MIFAGTGIEQVQLKAVDQVNNYILHMTSVSVAVPLVMLRSKVKYE